MWWLCLSVSTVNIVLCAVVVSVGKYCEHSVSKIVVFHVSSLVLVLTIRFIVNLTFHVTSVKWISKYCILNILILCKAALTCFRYYKIVEVYVHSYHPQSVTVN